jgi:Tfp pilus assembly PilM family ATPase
MTGLTAQTGSPTNSTTGSKNPPGVSKAISMSWQLPRRQFPLGRRLAFSFDGEAVQMAAASHTGKRISLLGVRKTYIPRSAVTPDEQHAHVLGAIREFVEEFGGRWPGIAVTVDGQETALRSILMPKLKPRDLAAAVKFEARRQIPFPVEDCEFEYRTVQNIATGSEQQSKVALLAATRHLVQEKLTPLQELGLEVGHVYHAQDVIGQLLPWLPHFNPDMDYAFVNVQRDHSEISYYHGSNLAFFHVSSLGSSFLANRNDPTMFEYFSESLATEIQNSLDYYSGQYSSQFANEIFVYGDLAYSDELIGRLTDRFGLSFVRFPAELLGFVHRKNLPFEDTLPVCLPALAAVICQAKLANLLPETYRARRRNKIAGRLSMAAAVTIAGLLAISWLSDVSTVRTANERLRRVEQEVEQFRASEMFATYNLLKRSIASSESFIAKTKDAPSYFGLNLKELSRLTPASVRLQHLDFQPSSGDHNFVLAGVITTENSPPELVLAEFVENLEASPFYDNIRVDRNVKKRVPEGFQLEFNLSLDGVI